MSRRRLDLAVIGAGPCGLAVGAAASRSDLQAVLFDQGPLCASIVQYPPYLSFFSTAEKLEIEGLPFVTTRPNPTRLEALNYYRGVSRYFDLSVRPYHSVRSVARTTDGFSLEIDHKGETTTVSARAVVVATGGFSGPNYLEVPGEDLPKVLHYYTEAHPFWDQDVVVVGGGNSAVEAALDLFRVGARVTLVHFADVLDSGVKAWVVPDITNRLDTGEIAVRWRHRVAEVRTDSVVLRSEETGETEVLANDWMLALTGWKPDPVILRSLDVPIDAETGVPEHDPETMQTPIPGLYIAGVLAAGYDANRIFIENGRVHGRLIVNHLRGRD